MTDLAKRFAVPVVIPPAAGRGRVDHDDDVHVYPLAGRAHETSVRCWCSPVRDEDVPAVVVHREEN